MRFSLSFLLALAFVFASQSEMRADYVWREGFEVYPAGSINTLGTTWYVEPAGIDWGGAIGNVVTNPAHSGAKALQVGSVWSFWGGWGHVNWGNDTGTDYGGLVQLSWWMDVQQRTWDIFVKGWYFDGGMVVREVAGLSTRMGTSNTTLDVKTSGGWIELPAAIPFDAWRQVFLEIDLNSQPAKYRVRVGDAGPWYGWYTEDNRADYFRELSLASGNVGGTQFFMDEFTMTAVPEPATFVLVATFALSGLPFLCRRRLRA